MSDNAGTEENYDAPRPEDFVLFEDAVDISRKYQAHMVSGERKRRPSDAKWHAGRLEVKGEFRIAHDESLPTDQRVCQGKRVRFSYFTDDRRFQTFCKGLGMDPVTFDPKDYPDLKAVITVKKRMWDKPVTDPETGETRVEPTPQVDVDQVFRA